MDEKHLNVQWYVPVTKWRNSFAWWPVETADRGWVWFVPIQIRRMKYTLGGERFKNQYVTKGCFTRDE